MKTSNLQSIIFLIIISLFTNQAWSQSNSNDNTTFWVVGITSEGRNVGIQQYNGRFWSSLNKEQKTAFIAGLMEGVNAYYTVSGVATTQKFSEYEKLRDTFFAKEFYPREIVNIINDIYKDHSNVRIPVFEIHRVAIKKSEGLSQLKIDNLLSDLRQKCIQ